MKKTYIGPLGQFPKGRKQDVPDETAEKLIKNKKAVKCLPPWEQKTNLAMVEFEQLKKNVEKIDNEIAGNILSMNKAKEAADSIPRYGRIVETLQGNLVKAHKALFDFAAKNNIPLEKKADGKQEEKTGGAETDSGPKNDDDAAGQAASTGQDGQ